MGSFGLIDLADLSAAGDTTNKRGVPESSKSQVFTAKWGTAGEKDPRYGHNLGDWVIRDRKGSRERVHGSTSRW